ncbi:MAG: EAL domain-containing protein [Kofleriaceae bacterium]|nr:EAL domain-containing protein [Kofleriaceae bacterium]MCL4228993.1 EAL domain-containing protein [Myxococcales bacterium]
MLVTPPIVSTGPCRRTPLVDVASGRAHAVEVQPGWGMYGVLPCIEQAAGALPAWRAQLGRPGLAMVVDLALAELAGLGSDDVCDVLARHDLAPDALILRVPSFAAGDPTAELDRLADMGVSIAVASLDLRGAGAGLLGGAPVDLIELPPAAVALLDLDGDALHEIELTAELAHRHDWLTYARDVARPEQLAALRRFGCDLVAGPAVTLTWPAIAQALERVPAPLAS